MCLLLMVMNFFQAFSFSLDILFFFPLKYILWDTMVSGIIRGIDCLGSESGNLSSKPKSVNDLLDNFPDITKP